MDNNQIIIYQTEDGKVKIETHFENENVWLNQSQIAELFQKERSVITKHIGNIFKEGELDKKSNVQILHISGSDKPVKFYNLDVIISVGYRVKSHRGIHFRKWATTLIKEYLIKGFAMNDEFLKDTGGGNYFEELLARIRDIRSSEKVFWRKVLDIYAISIDYDASAELSVLFFKTVQNKMHWASHGETAAETVYRRVSADKDNLGLTNFKGEYPSKQELEVAKNYLTKEELNILNRMVTAYLEVAEIQALNRTPMYMADWIKQLDSFLKMTGKEILSHSGTISHHQALEKAHLEFNKYKQKVLDNVSRVEKDFLMQIEKDVKKAQKK